MVVLDCSPERRVNPTAWSTSKPLRRPRPEVVVARIAAAMEKARAMDLILLCCSLLLPLVLSSSCEEDLASERRKGELREGARRMCMGAGISV